MKNAHKIFFYTNIFFKNIKCGVVYIIEATVEEVNIITHTYVYYYTILLKLTIYNFINLYKFVLIR